MSLLAATPQAFAVEGPPTVNGVIKDPNLVRNSDVAKAQAVGAITTFMSKGAQECDSDGRNCRSVFGADDTPDYTTLQFQGQAATGVEGYSFQTDDNDAGSVSTQMGTLALACGDTKVKQVAGLALKALSCVVSANGDARLSVQVCTAPARGNPISPPENAVACSSNPSAPNFVAPQGMVCLRPTCDTEPLNSLNGWSSPKDIVYKASLPANATEADKSNNGMAMVLYPNPAAGVQVGFGTDSDNMTAVKVIQSFLNNDTGVTAVGLRVAYRHKTQLTKEMMSDQGAITNPSEHTSQWDTLTKLQANPLVAQHQATFASNGSECLQQIQQGVASDGLISVCEPGYTNESGIRPLQLTAQVAADGQECGSIQQCLAQTVTTSEWMESCQVSVPLALRDCTTTQDYTVDKISYTRTLTQEICHEKRLTAEYSCNTIATTGAAETFWAPAMDLSANGSTAAQTVLMYDRAFNTPEGAMPIGGKFTYLHIDNHGEIRLNGRRIWASYDNNLQDVKRDAWGVPDLVSNCANDVWEEYIYNDDGNSGYWYTRSGVRCTMQNGQRVQANYSDYCSEICETNGQHVVDISFPAEYIREGNNLVQLACFNNKGASACNYQMQVLYAKITQYIVDNTACARYEEAR